MRWIATFVAFLALACAACTSPSGDPPSPTLTAPHTTASAPAPVTSSTSVAPPHPTRPSVPADVPRTGPNTKPGEKPPVMPLEATQHTPEGAKAFAEFFIKTIDWGYATTSSAYMRHYFKKVCDSCIAIASEFDRDRRLNRHYIGDRYDLRSSRVVYSRPNSVRLVIDVGGTAGLLIGSHRRTVRADPALNLRFGINCAPRRSSWTVTDLGVVS